MTSEPAAAPGELRELAKQLSRWLFEDALPLWWQKGADRATGGFHEVLDLDGAPAIRPRRARVQARQSYVYAVAGTLGWPGPWRSAAPHGLQYLRDHYRHEDGAFCTMVSPAGAIMDRTVTLYDQAFAMMAMAHVSHVLPDQAGLKDDARRVAAYLATTRRHPAGGFVESASHRFQSNPHMHLLEASLAWCAVSPEPVWNALADETAELCLSKFIDARGGFLREFFAEDWSPAEGRDGKIVEPGHQFEWAWLLERWGLLRGRDDARQQSRRLYQAGRRGIDRARNVAMDELSDDFSVARATARLWPQTEWLKAALLLSRSADGAAREALLKDAVDAARALSAYLQTPVAGLWRDRMEPDGEFVEEPAPASSFYHIICSIQSLREASGTDS